MTMAMSSTEHTLWLTADIIGLVVVIAVAALFLGRVLGKVKSS
jgi:uncharacterized membrane protein SirB2